MQVDLLKSTNLKILSLNNNKIESIKFKDGKLKRIKVLNINSNKIQIIFGLDELSKYKNLKKSFGYQEIQFKKRKEN